MVLTALVVACFKVALQPLSNDTNRRNDRVFITQEIAGIAAVAAAGCSSAHRRRRQRRRATAAA